MVTTREALNRLSERFSMIGTHAPSSKSNLCLAYPKTRARSPLAKELTSLMREVLADEQ